MDKTTAAKGITRLHWPDLVRGICVILVVAMHIYTGSYERWVDGHDGISRAWSLFISAAQPIRMPIFFLVSGYLATRAINRPFKDTARSRVGNIVYLYFLWLGIYTFCSFLVGETFSGDQFSLAEYVSQIWWPQTALWYLYALVVYFLIARLVRRFPTWIPLAAALVLSIIGTAFLEGTAEYVTRSLFFYLVGALLPELVSRFPARHRWGGTLLALAGYGALGAVGLYLGGGWQDGIGAVASLLGVPLFVAIAKFVGERRIWVPFVWFGRNTLPIFVMHPMLVLFWNQLVDSSESLRAYIQNSTIVHIAYVIVLTAIIAIVSVYFRKLCDRIRLRWLFELPQWGRSKA